MDNKVLGEKIKNIRKAMGLTQEQLAEKVGIDYKYLSKIENGLHLPNYKTLLKFTSILGVKFDDINDENIVKESNPFLVKSLKILNSASNDDERKYYYSALKFAQKGINSFCKK